jgi:hypothetical protein
LAASTPADARGARGARRRAAARSVPGRGAARSGLAGARSALAPAAGAPCIFAPLAAQKAGCRVALWARARLGGAAMGVWDAVDRG